MYIGVHIEKVLFVKNKFYTQMHLITSVKCMINGDKIKWNFDKSIIKIKICSTLQITLISQIQRTQSVRDYWVEHGSEGKLMNVYKNRRRGD